ncbi:hypothetical protein PVAND_013344 [Polypedilum vanderplanki]|uniref:MAGE domain-containing protein n=1 Tax=Polypedilum vanderplanki TaxID=319348 RepID=A0A9J6CQE4_POLVA|nr:hypothetical protein PVAND_013344 [Polypedilum vanderplanki]
MPRPSRKSTNSQFSQPSTSHATQRVSESESSDEENNKSRRKKSQLSQSQIHSTVNIELLTTNLVKYVINHSCNKIPMKRADLTKQLTIPRKEFDEIFEGAQEILKNVYGLELTEIPETKSSKLLITYSSIPLVTPLQMNDEETKDMQLLFIILSYLFMKNADIPEDNVINFMNQLGIEAEDFTKSREIFIKQLYLKRNKVEIEGKNDAYFTLSWGERAKLEFDKKQILEAVAKIMEKSPQAFINQYHAAHGHDPNQSQNLTQVSMIIDD